MTHENKSGLLEKLKKLNKQFDDEAQKKYRLQNWHNLGFFGKIWRVVWLTVLGLTCLIVVIINSEQSQQITQRNSTPFTTDQDISSEQNALNEEQIPLLNATVNWMPDDLSAGMKYVNSIMIGYQGNLTIHLNKPRLRNRELIYSYHDDEVEMIGVSYSCNDGNSYYNNDRGTSERLTLENLNYSAKHTEFEFVAMLQTNLRDKGKSVKVRFSVDGEHFDNAIKAGIIMPES